MFRSLATLCLAFSAFMASPVVTYAEGVWKQYPSSTTALAYDGEYFWIGQEYTILKWHKDRGVVAEYTPKDGLPGSWIREIYIAPDSATVWAATDSSIARFDGTAWRTMSAHEGGPDGSIGGTAFEPDGSLWILTRDGKGVYRYARNTWTHYTVADGLASNTVHAIAVDTEGVVWVGTDKGVSAFDGTNWKTYTTADGLSDNAVTHIVVDRNNVKWFGSGYPAELNGGITRFNGSTWSSYTMDNGAIDAKEVVEMAVGPDNTLWVSMGDLRYHPSPDGHNGFFQYHIYLYKFDGEQFDLTRSRVHYDSTPITLFYQWLVFDQDGNLNVLSDIHSFSTYLLRKNQVCDRDNVIWFLEGWDSYYWLVRYDGERHPQGFGPPDDICALAVGPQNELWVGESDGGLCEFSNNTWRVSTYELKPFKNFYLDIFCLAANEEDTVWVGGSYSRLGRFAWDDPRLINSQVPATVVSMSFDKNGILWMGFGSGGRGVVGYDGTAWPQYTTADGLVNDEVHAIAVDSGNAMWFGTSAGISRYDGTAWTSFITAENDTPVGRVTTLAFDTRNTLWAGTGSGLLRYDGSVWTRFTPNEGLADTLVLSLATGPDGVVWAGTPKGLSRYDGTSWKTFTTADGLPGDRVQALAVDHNKVVWVGTDRGLVSYREENGVFVDDTPGVPVAFPTVSVYPNPFNPSTIIDFTLGVGQKAELAIYSITGQKVRDMVSGPLSAGSHSYRWDGKDDSGIEVSSGVYFARLKAGNQVSVKKMALVR